MKIKRKGNAFVAYRTEESECTNPLQKIGSECGRISITTGRFSGATGFMVELHQHLKEFLKPKEEAYQKLVDDVIENIKKDIADGDVTVLEELLKFIPEEYLKGSLPE